MKKDISILSSSFFLFGVTVLLLNDFVLKDLFHNSFTGKLSDFAGLFIFPIFWSALLPRLRKAIYVTTLMGFVYWKSSSSQPLIDYWNHLELFNIARVVDASDLLALIMLPVAYAFETSNLSFRKVNISPALPLLVAAFSFAATSYQTDLDINKTYTFDFSRDSLEIKMNQVSAINSEKGISFKNQNPDTVLLRVQSDACFDFVEVTVVVEALAEHQSQLSLTRVEHSCPKKDADEKVVIQEFESKVVQIIKNIP